MPNTAPRSCDIARYRRVREDEMICAAMCGLSSPGPELALKAGDNRTAHLLSRSRWQYMLSTQSNVVMRIIIGLDSRSRSRYT